MTDASGRIARTVHNLVPSIDPAHDLKDAAKGKTILITGGGQGAGRAMTEQFARAGAATVVIVGRTLSALHAAKAEIEAAVPGVQIVAVETNVRSAESVEALFAALPRTPDVLVNNAGTYTSPGPIADSDPERWWGDMEVSLKGAYLCTRAYLRRLAHDDEKGDGRKITHPTILNVSSGGSDNVSGGMSAYGTSKLALNRLTEMTHFESFESRGVRCIAFSPGSMAATTMGQNAPPQFRHLLPDHVDLAGGFAVYLSTERAAFLSGRFVFSNWETGLIEAQREAVLRDDLLVSRLRYGDAFSGEK